MIARGLEALGVELILAGSPQAKGRVERTFGTAQDRLIKEMRVAGIATLDAANRFLAERWMPFWNERFAVAAVEPLDAHRPLPPGTDLEALFADTETRVVGRDYTVRWKNRFWQVPATEAQAAGVRPGSRVVVERRLSGELRFRRGDRYLALEALGADRPAPPAPRPRPTRPRPKPRKPGRDHPWRKQIREEVERAMAKRERRLARLAASGAPDSRADPLCRRERNHERPAQTAETAPRALATTRPAVLALAGASWKSAPASAKIALPPTPPRATLSGSRQPFTVSAKPGSGDQDVTINGPATRIQPTPFCRPHGRRKQTQGRTFLLRPNPGHFYCGLTRKTSSPCAKMPSPPILRPWSVNERRLGNPCPGSVITSTGSKQCIGRRRVGPLLHSWLAWHSRRFSPSLARPSGRGTTRRRPV